MQHSRHWSVHVFRSCVREVNVLDGAHLVTKVGLCAASPGRPCLTTAPRPTTRRRHRGVAQKESVSSSVGRSRLSTPA
jgi:hypothetical protein